MNRVAAARMWVGVGVLAAVALLPAGRVLQRLAFGSPLTRGISFVTRYDARFARLRAALPPDASVGYLSPVVPTRVLTDPQASGHFFLTQYALCPVVTVNDPDRPLVAANFYTRVTPQAMPDLSRFTHMQDFGSGVVLYRRGEP